MEKIVEICCGSLEDAIAAQAGGAKRIELNSALHMGGLTPSIATLLLVKAKTDLKVICMVRERGAGFCYDEWDKQVMFYNAKIMLENGADGLAFGFLNEDKSVDMEACKQMVELAHSYGKEAVFHRAVDVCADYEKAFADIVSCGVDRILTSGGQVKAVEGIRRIKEMQERFGEQIEILAGCGVNEDNAQYIMDNTGIVQVHSSCKSWKHDPTTSHFGVNYSYAGTNKYDVVCADLVKALIASLK